MTLCEHLKLIFDYEIQRGNEVKEISEGWSKAKLVVDLEKPMDISYGLNHIEKDSCVRYWENNDLHYLRQKGFYCDKCNHSLAGPVE